VEGEKYNIAALPYVFLIPTILLAIFWFVNKFIVRNTPGEAGFSDFDTADASSGDDGPQLGAIEVFKKMLTNPIIITIAMIEFCSGFLRQAIMQWFPSYAKQTDCGYLTEKFPGEVATITEQCLPFKESFVMENWGMLLCCAGIMGGVIAGVISDRVFQSRRGPVAAVLYGTMLLGAIVMVFTYKTAFLPWLVVLMSACIIGVHGMLSGTASMDFGGKKNVGVAVGIIDGFVYAGTAVMSFTYARVLPSDALVEGEGLPAASDPSNWFSWPVSMIPLALIGLLLATRIWNAKPKSKQKAPEPEAA
jgi:OPA family glycerol-3-phosphate transporter-like MFS transporter